MENTRKYVNKTKLSTAVVMLRDEEETRSLEEIYLSLGGLLVEDAKEAPAKKKTSNRKKVKKSTKK